MAETKRVWKEPWSPLTNDGASLIRELERELHPGHPLFGKNVYPVGVGWAGDDVVFELENGSQLAVVHLTWSGRPEKDGFPHTVFFDDWECFMASGA